MKKLGKCWYTYPALILFVLVLAGCTSTNDDAKEASLETPTASASTSNQQDEESEEKNLPDKSEDNPGSAAESEIAASNHSEETPADSSETEEPNQSSEETTTSEDSTDTYENKVDDPLTGYSAEEIEYARVWLQLGPNQQIDGLYVRHIPAGTPLEPDYFPVVSYPEDVVQLSGSRIVDGSVTYSSNGDGTINVYNVPLPGRWFGGSPAPPEGLDEDTMREDLEDIINNTEHVYVNPRNDEAVKKFIDLINK
ncbi:hypothetical protein CHH91_09680 [Virgibacillus sp. 7505]|uniref:hypothetical protein n=1 Tax=Virgibacillus sp. 7505 TaxID=2022548 RepID=UPI000BA572C6|nr:hypothetical protein [Virgibacillus sp. 7505]PAE16336.1 hypothetical protein CHH91_09680 [Virgibacillus sp. 7505]